MNAPFVYFGGKRQIAEVVWRRLGDVTVYVEPFAGSLAVLLARPESQWRQGRIETVNDLDGYIVNAWRAIAWAPEETAKWADWPPSSVDLHARHAWLVQQRQSLLDRLLGDPEYFDVRTAGWWLWCSANFIGSGFCSGNGPWVRRQVNGEWRLVNEPGSGEGADGARISLGNSGRGVCKTSLRGLDDIIAWFKDLSARLRQVRICYGDWRQVLSPCATHATRQGSKGIFLDPPYGSSRKKDLYCQDSHDIHKAVQEWCLSAPPDYRIALCGYEGEHTILESKGWTVYAWTAKGGIGNLYQARGRDNRHRERVWFSPACLSDQQLLW